MTAFKMSNLSTEWEFTHALGVRRNGRKTSSEDIYSNTITATKSKFHSTKTNFEPKSTKIAGLFLSVIKRKKLSNRLSIPWDPHEYFVNYSRYFVNGRNAEAKQKNLIENKMRFFYFCLCLVNGIVDEIYPVDSRPEQFHTPDVVKKTKEWFQKVKKDDQMQKFIADMVRVRCIYSKLESVSIL